MYKLLLAYLVSSLCGWCAAFLVPLVINDITGSAFYTAVAYGVSFLPYFLVMPIGGVMADIFNKKRMMQFLELTNVVLIGVLIMVPFTTTNINLILLLHFMVSSVVAVQHPIFQGMIPTIVPKKKAANFHSYTGTISNVISLGAPALIGFFFWVFKNHISELGNAEPTSYLQALLFKAGAKKALCYILGVGYLLAFVLISWLRYEHHDLKKKWGLRTIFRGLQEAVAYVRTEPFFKYTIIFFFFTCFAGTFVSSNLVHYLKQQGISEEYLGYYYIPMGVGAILGSMLAPYIVNRIACVKIILYACTIEAIATWLVLISPTPYFIIGFRTVNNALTSIIVVAYFTLRQKIVPAHLLSRTVAVTRMMAWASIPLAAVGSGFLFEKTQNFQYLIIVSAIAISLALILCWRPLIRAEPKLQTTK